MTPIDVTNDQQSSSLSLGERLALWCGVGFVVVQLAGLGFFTGYVIPQFPAIDAPVTERATFFAGHGSLMLTTNFLLMLAWPLLLLFSGGLYAILRRAEGSGGALAASALSAAIAVAVIISIGWTTSNVIAVTVAQEGGDPATVAAFDALSPYSLALSGLPRAVMLIAASIVLLRSHIGPRWIGWLGVVLSVISVAGAGTLVVVELFPLTALGSLLFDIWVLSLSVTLLRQPAGVRQPASQALPA